MRQKNAIEAGRAGVCGDKNCAVTRFDMLPFGTVDLSPCDTPCMVPQDVTKGMQKVAGWA
ncbi:hypothetical protein AA105894_0840 [Asaia spathodeae NBRC 105894]|nr:hypothetical protein AA105894_0840 [Asaia spathodeae NBRC 105894]